MIRGVRIPRAALEDILAGLETRGNRSVAVCAAGEYRRADMGILELLHVSTAYAGRTIEREVEAIVRSGLRPLLIVSRDVPDQQIDRYVRALRRSGAPTAGILAFVGPRQDIRVRGGFVEKSELAAIEYLALPGQRMLRLAVEHLDGGLRNRSGHRGRERSETGRSTKATKSRHQLVSNDGRSSRFAGALGGGNVRRGYEYIAQATALTLAVVGVGRLGLLTAYRLAQSGMGADGGLILADGDVVEEHNLDVMILPPQSVGMHKSRAAAGMIQILFPEVKVVPIEGTLSDREVSEAVMAADVIFSAVDDEAARVGAALIARRYHKVHLDIAGGAAYVGGNNVVTGGEIRVSVPGSHGCVGCFGTHQWDEIERSLKMSAEEEKRSRMRTVWHAQRPGSWGDVLLPIVGESQQLLWRLITGEVRQSMWLHYEHTDGLPEWQDWTPKRRILRRCPICSRQQGLGDLHPKRGQR